LLFEVVHGDIPKKNLGVCAMEPHNNAGGASEAGAQNSKLLVSVSFLL
jgi:hypothetical protein